MANVNFMRGDTEKMDNTAIMDGLIFFNTEENEMFLDDGNTRKQFSGAGHIIENNAGTDMAKRRNMQFKGAYVEDDSENNRTKVNVIRKMTDTEFSQLTEAEKQGIIKTTTDNNLPFDATMVEYDNTQSDLSSTTVQGAIDELNSDIDGATTYSTTTSIIGKLNLGDGFDRVLKRTVVYWTSIPLTSAGTAQLVLPNQISADNILSIRGRMWINVSNTSDIDDPLGHYIFPIPYYDDSGSVGNLYINPDGSIVVTAKIGQIAKPSIVSLAIVVEHV